MLPHPPRPLKKKTNNQPNKKQMQKKKKTRAVTRRRLWPGYATLCSTELFNECSWYGLSPKLTICLLHVAWVQGCFVVHKYLSAQLQARCLVLFVVAGTDPYNVPRGLVVIWWWYYETVRWNILQNIGAIKIDGKRGVASHHPPDQPHACSGQAETFAALLNSRRSSSEMVCSPVGPSSQQVLL